MINDIDGYIKRKNRTEDNAEYTKNNYEWLVVFTVFRNYTRTEIPVHRSLSLIHILKDEIDVLISVDPMFNDDRWVRREIYRESFLVLSKDKIENPCTFEDLQRLSITRPYISYGAGSQDKIVCDRFLRGLNVRPLETVTASSSYVITGLSLIHI